LPPTSSCLSPLSPSFIPGLRFDENAFWSLGHEGPSLEIARHSTCDSREAQKDIRERGRSHTAAGPAMSRTSSVPRPSSCVGARTKQASVPAVRMSWADGHTALKA
jgi:hypothetical protein